MLSLRDDLQQLPQALFSPLPRLAVPYLRVLAEVAGNAARTVDPKILEIEPGHPVARRNIYVTASRSRSIARSRTWACAIRASPRA